MSAALALLRRADVRIASGDLRSMSLVLPERRAFPVVVEAYTTLPQPRVMDKLVRDLRSHRPEQSLLLVVPRSTDHLRSLALRSVLNLVAVDEELVLMAGAVRSVAGDSRPVQHLEIPRRRGRRPWLRWALERILLLADDPVAVSDLADRMQTSHQAVSKALRDHPYLDRSPAGWLVQQRDALLERFMAEYPGPGGAATYWYSLDAPALQIAAARRFCDEMDVDALVGGDVAVDRYAPWRLPVTAALYTRELLDFVPIGFTVAPPGDHTLVTTIPRDPTIWLTVPAPRGGDTAFVDPVLALYDATHNGGSDADEAAERLRRAVLDHTLRR